ncbi:hypothetical protein PZE06_21275 [Robertmurraya sp. DFI.2.37]|uniref:hypothetical protein n=1 Tax=Robertmurraya sp. DFI.2.37 TaxID=3031819 RepID=UPI0012487702|nr:hypothetical protein [Robertmurraya sp. DFI.2.37]MDF1510670.1 hypothetical protein [Robertmurraya sp. DFI.2.37]
MNQYLLCPVCDYDYSHIIATLQVKDNDDYQTTEVIVNQTYPISVKTEYKYRSQGNMHILFQCEEGHYFIKSFDGHKGNVSIDENPLMDELAEYLNRVYKDQKKLSLSFNYELLGNIEKFLKSKNR